MKVHTAQLAGGTSNADRVFVTDHAVIVLDGATAFAPVDVDPGEYADTLGATIADLLDTDSHAWIREAVAAAIDNTAAKLHLHAEASPSSTVAILRTRREVADLYVLGDSPIFYGTDSNTHELADERLAALPLKEREQYAGALRAGAGYGEQHRATLVALQRAQRGLRNTEVGYWIAETDPNAAAHGLTTAIPAERITWAVLATDGAADLIGYHGSPGWPEIAQYDSDALSELLALMHKWESADDPHGILLPRAKQHDDKTVAAVRALW